MLLAKSLNQLRALEARLDAAKAAFDGDYAGAWAAAARECLYEGRLMPIAIRASELRRSGPKGWDRV